MHRDSAAPAIYRHTRLVRITHWINALSFVLLVPSGIAILLAHPEFYWGEVGYFGHPAALTLPLQPNFDHTGWGRGLHFLFAWVLVLNGLVYLLCGLINGHFRRQMLPKRAELGGGHLWREIREHLRFARPKGEATRHYNVLQKIA
jgi:thiosulfate reductase cytochrome b subunit